ncbi:hypothetical protein [uncultured Mameliella sp.]|uniref:hypothetical protein n=1 Tax=uncultured Mameliella sp. TaxID=1447087 RepID=UPI002613B0AF|nr:hypothetical protein [uncultured Mameliella sp.]
MELTIGAALYAEISRRFFHPAFLAFIDWPGDPVYAHGGRGPLSWDGQTWLGVQGIGMMQLPGQSEGMAQRIAELTLASIPADLSDYLTADARGATVEIYLGAYTTREGVALVGDPVLFFTGVIDGRAQTIEAGEGGQKIRSLKIQVRTGPSQRSVGVGYITRESRSVDYPDDTLLRHAAGAEAFGRDGGLLR